MDKLKKGKSTREEDSNGNKKLETVLLFYPAFIYFVHEDTKAEIPPLYEGGSKNRNPRNPSKFTKSNLFNRPYRF